jgi:hypothetical protein
MILYHCYPDSTIIQFANYLEKEFDSQLTKERQHTPFTIMQLGLTNIAHQHLEFYSTVVIWPYLKESYGQTS